VVARVAMLGFGLIGGSLARALAGLSPDRRPEVVAWSPSGRGPSAALAEGVLVGILDGPAQAWTRAEVIVLAAPPLACLDLMDALARARPSVASDDAGATITDVASTKARLVERADRRGLRYVGGHPMAGREVAGYGAADGGLFAGRPWVVVPGAMAGSIDVERVEWLARSVGALPVPMTPADHDRAVAAISHLPLTVAAALVEAVIGGPDDPDRADWPEARELAAGGWTSMTRLALGDAEMGAGILATNAAETAARLRALRDVIDRWLADLEAPGGPDAERLRRRLQAARERLSPPGAP
jgi:prephenate dehydrogenase